MPCGSCSGGYKGSSGSVKASKAPRDERIAAEALGLYAGLEVATWFSTGVLAPRVELVVAAAVYAVVKLQPSGIQLLKVTRGYDSVVIGGLAMAWLAFSSGGGLNDAAIGFLMGGLGAFAGVWAGDTIFAAATK